MYILKKQINNKKQQKNETNKGVLIYKKGIKRVFPIFSTLFN